MRVPRVSPTTYRRIVLAALAALVFIMVTGAAVRLTGSGLGCSTWPTCEPDSFTPRSASDTHGMIEWVNRLITGAITPFAVATVLGALWRTPYRRDLFLISLGLPAWVLANALVGALVVVLDLSPVSVIAHFLLSLGSVANAVVLYERAAHGPPLRDPDAPGGVRRAATPAVVATCRVLAAAACVVIVTGTLVTGSGPHAGDERADRLDLTVGDIVRVHGAAMVVFLVTTLVAVRRAHRGDTAPLVVDRLHELLVVLVAQAAVGYWQYFTGVPAWLVGIHVLGAALVWIAVVRVWLGLTVRSPEEIPEVRGDGMRLPVRQ